MGVGGLEPRMLPAACGRPTGRYFEAVVRRNTGLGAVGVKGWSCQFLFFGKRV